MRTERSRARAFCVATVVGLTLCLAACPATLPLATKQKTSDETGDALRQATPHDKAASLDETSAAAPCCGTLAPAAEQVLNVLDQSGVDHLWLRHRHIVWDTGVPDEPEDYRGRDTATHCSSYAAAMGMRLGVYMLRPPEHPQQLLANAQTRWFGSRAAQRDGWYPIADAVQAQRAANSGALVVIVYANPDPHRPGHIGIVRPGTLSLGHLRDAGPDVAEAGEHNAVRISARAAFKWHPGAWPDGVRYYAHAAHAAHS